MATVQAAGYRFENIQAVVFDKDGTLARSEDFLRGLAQRRARLIDAQIPGVQEPLLLAFGIEAGQINPAGLMAVGTRLENEVAAAAYVAETGKGWVEACELVQQVFQEADPGSSKAEATPLIAGSLELMQRLAAADLKLAILSSDSKTQVEDFVSYYDLWPYVQAALGVDAQHSHKADPALLQALFDQLAVSPAQTLMIGDSQLDGAVARQIGMAGCIGFNGGWTLNLPQIATADVMVSQFEQILLL